MGIRGFEASADGSDFDQLWTEDIAKSQGRVTDSGLYPYVSADYVIFKVGSTYYRRDGSSGIVDDSNADAATLIQGCFDALPTSAFTTAEGSHVVIMPAQYDIASALDIMRNGFVLDCYGTLKATGAIAHVLKVGIEGTQTFGNRLYIKYIDCNSLATDGVIIASQSDGRINGLHVNSSTSIGLKITGDGVVPTSNFEVNSVTAAYHVTGFSADPFTEYVDFSHCQSYLSTQIGFSLAGHLLSGRYCISTSDGSSAVNKYGFSIESYKSCFLEHCLVLPGSNTKFPFVVAFRDLSEPAEIVIRDCNVWGAVPANTEILSVDVKNYPSHHLIVDGLQIQTAPVPLNFLHVFGTDGKITLKNSRLQGSLVDALDIVVFENNLGYVTENAGTGSITNGGTTDVIAHGCDYTPVLADIMITLGENPTNTPGAIWVDTIGAANFTVNCENDPGASNLDFSWSVRQVHR